MGKTSSPAYGFGAEPDPTTDPLAVSFLLGAIEGRRHVRKEHVGEFNGTALMRFGSITCKIGYGYTPWIKDLVKGLTYKDYLIVDALTFDCAAFKALGLNVVSDSNIKAQISFPDLIIVDGSEGLFSYMNRDYFYDLVCNGRSEQLVLEL